MGSRDLQSGRDCCSGHCSREREDSERCCSRNRDSSRVGRDRGNGSSLRRLAKMAKDGRDLLTGFTPPKGTRKCPRRERHTRVLFLWPVYLGRILGIVRPFKGEESG